MKRLKSLLLVLLIIFLAGCRAPAQTEALKLGLVAPFEGAQRALGYEVLAATRLALREQNAAGGYRGRPLTLAALNDEDEPAQAAWRARELALDPAVVAVVGHWSRPTTAAALPIYQAAGLPLVIPSAGDYALAAPALQVAPDDAALVEATVGFLRERAGVRQVALRVEPAALRARLAAALVAAGFDVLPDDAPASAADYAVLWLDDDEAARFVRQAGAPPTILLSAPYLPQWEKLVGAGAPAPWVWTLAAGDAAEEGRFAAAFRAETGHAPSSQARLAYRAARAALGGGRPARPAIIFEQVSATD